MSGKEKKAEKKADKDKKSFGDKWSKFWKDNWKNSERRKANIRFVRNAALFIGAMVLIKYKGNSVGLQDEIVVSPPPSR